MRKSSILKAILVFSLLVVTYSIHGQTKPSGNQEEVVASSSKPFKVLTNGKQITIQAKQNLKSLMVWTASGHRIVEEKEMKANNYSFSVPSKEKFIFMVAEMADGKKFTEKIGLK